MVRGNWRDDVQQICAKMGGTPGKNWRDAIREINENISFLSPREYHVVIAPSTATDELKASADYVCTGSKDEEVINEAIEYAYTTWGDTITTGHRVNILLLEGDFVLSGPIRYRSYITLRGFSNWVNIFPDDSEGAVLPDRDWYIFESKMEDPATEVFFYIYDLSVYAYGINNWAVTGRCKGIYKSYRKQFFSARNCDFGSPLAAQFTVDSTATKIRMGFLDSSIWSENSSIDSLIDLTNAAVKPDIQLLNMYLGYAANAIKLGSQNPTVSCEGYIQYGSLTNFFNGTSTGIATFACNILKRSGTATVTSGNTYIDVTHGRAKTPTAQEITITPTNNLGSATGWWVDNIGSTTFRINVDANPGGNATFAWRIE